MGAKWIVQRYDGLGSISESCKRLFARAGRESFFLSLAWFRNLEETVVEGDGAVRVYVVESSGEDGTAVGAIVLWSRRRGRQWYAPTIMQGLSNYYTAYFGPLWQGEEKGIEEFAGLLAEAVFDDRHLWDVLDLRPLDPKAPLFQALVKAFRAKGCPVQTHCCFGNWYLPLNKRSFSQYLESLPKVLRKNIPYQTRRLDRTFRVEIKLVIGWPGLMEALTDYETVYNSSWREGEAYPEFIRRLAKLAADEGWLRLSVLYADGKAIAAQFWIVQGTVGSIYKVCYDEQYAKYSVGTVLTAYMMRHAIEVDKVEQIDFLSGDDSYKKDWMSDRRERWGILAFNRTSGRGVLQAVGHIGRRLVKKQLGRLTERFARTNATASRDAMPISKQSDTADGRTTASGQLER